MISAILVVSLSFSSALDRSTPANAATGCTKALAKKSAEHSACWDWSEHYNVFRKAVDRARERTAGGGDRKARVTFDGWLTTGEGVEAQWLVRYKPLAMSWIVERDPAAFGRHADRFFAYLADGTRGGKPATTKSPELAPVGDAALPNKNDLKISSLDHVGLMDLFGTLSVDEVFHITPNRAWIASRGKNPDGSVFRVATLWRRVDKEWAETLWKEDDLAALPKRFPQPQSFHALPQIIVTVFARDVLPLWLVTADPAGVVVTTDWENRWPRPPPPPPAPPPPPPPPTAPPSSSPPPVPPSAPPPPAPPSSSPPPPAPPQ